MATTFVGTTETERRIVVERSPVRRRKGNLPEFVREYIDSRGKPRVELRRPGHKLIDMRPFGAPWSTSFMTAHAALMSGQTPTGEAFAAVPAPVAIPEAMRSTPGSLSLALARYEAHGEFRKAITRKYYLQRLAHLERGFGDMPIAKMSTAFLTDYIATLPPNKNRDTFKALRHFLKFAVADKLIDTDPSDGIKRKAAPKTKGFYTWTEKDIETFEAKYPVGTPGRLSFALMLYLGLRVASACEIGPQHVHDEVDDEGNPVRMVRFTPSKTEDTTGFELVCPVHPELARVLDGTKVIGRKTFVTQEIGNGKPYTPKGLGAFMRRMCDDAGLEDCTSHGLRKAICRRLAEAGMDVLTIMSITGHTDPRQVMIYVAAANKAKLATRAMEVAKPKRKPLRVVA